ncbi:tetratricopeptide repeat protein [Aestuariirhabdus sp. LZHN29]|uniref:tetratricopeptide repeat protein n=1 Tax=Aestuariirhabdus sp. LZHN29 TaxID=3417462 RepID=UPI003CF4DA20
MLNRSTSVLLLCVLLSGCAGSSLKRQKPALVPNLPTTAVQAHEVTPELKAEYENAIAMLREGETDPAQDALNNLLKKDDQIAGAHLNLALILYRNGEYDQAKRSVERTLQLSPRNAAAYNLQGTLMRRGGNFDGAALAYANAMAADPNYAPAYLNMAILFDIYLQFWDDARQFYQRYQQLSTNPDPRVEHWLQDLNHRINEQRG